MGGHSIEQFCTDAALTSIFSFKFSTGMSEPPCVVRDRAPTRPLMLPLLFQENGFLFRLSICINSINSINTWDWRKHGLSHAQHRFVRLWVLCTVWLFSWKLQIWVNSDVASEPDPSASLLHFIWHRGLAPLLLKLMSVYLIRGLQK